MKDNKHNSLHLHVARKFIEYLSLDIIISSKLAVFLSYALRKLFASWNR